CAIEAAASRAQRTNASGVAREPPEHALGERRALLVEVALHRLAVRADDAPRVACEPLVAQRPPVLAVRDDEVLAPDAPRREEERDADALRDLEQRPALAVCLAPQPCEDRRELLRAGQRGGAVPQLRERPAKLRELDRRDVD